MFHIDSTGSIHRCHLPLGICDLAPHFATSLAAFEYHEKVMHGYGEDESMFIPF